MRKVVLSLFLVSFASGQQGKPYEAAPEMERLIRAFEGSYTTVEHHQPHAGFPNGGTPPGKPVGWPGPRGDPTETEGRLPSPQREVDYTRVFFGRPGAGRRHAVLGAPR